jgi:hypothetical protein
MKPEDYQLDRFVGGSACDHAMSRHIQHRQDRCTALAPGPVVHHRGSVAMNQVAATIVLRVVGPGAVCLALMGCATSQPSTLANGAQVQVVTCNGTARSTSDCYAKADQVCPTGYTMVSVTGESHPVMIATGGELISGHMMTESLTVQCH